MDVDKEVSDKQLKCDTEQGVKIEQVPTGIKTVDGVRMKWNGKQWRRLCWYMHMDGDKLCDKEARSGGDGLCINHQKEIYDKFKNIINPDFGRLLLLQVVHSQNVLNCVKKFTNVPKNLITPAMCDYAVSQDPKLLEHVPEKFITQEMCDKAVQANPDVLEHVPEKFITQEMCNKAVQANPKLLEHVPEKFITQEMCNKAVQANPDVLEHVPEKFITQEMCDKASVQVLMNFEFPEESMEQ